MLQWVILRRVSHDNLLVGVITILIRGSLVTYVTNYSLIGVSIIVGRR